MNFEEWLKAANEQMGTAAVAITPQPLGDKDKKKKLYDGRTKEGRKFVERMSAKKAAREAKKNVVAEESDIQEASKDIGTSKGGITVVDIGRGEIQLQGKFGLMVTIKKSDMTEVIKLMKLGNLK
jgi:hypothetical protein|tara:strand:+ start:1908 stop:2282 length:375 start_codon:yes stop_codon:yes gene_type:complete